MSQAAENIERHLRFVFDAVIAALPAADNHLTFVGLSVALKPDEVANRTKTIRGRYIYSRVCRDLAVSCPSDRSWITVRFGLA